tara:strand:- start:26 stop:493 length:468 start_codon:yes stop_codon:yes gene_type:complete
MAHYKINELKGPFGYSREGDGTVVYMFVQDLDLNAVQQVVEYAYDNYTEDEEGEEVRDWAEYSPAMLDTETAGEIKDKLNCVEVTKNITTDGSVIEKFELFLVKEVLENKIPLIFLDADEKKIFQINKDNLKAVIKKYKEKLSIYIREYDHIYSY